jgi:hypothetical protein
MDIRGND